MKRGVKKVSVIVTETETSNFDNDLNQQSNDIAFIEPYVFCSSLVKYPHSLHMVFTS